MTEQFQIWLNDIRQVLCSINMSMEKWQEMWPFDFLREYEKGTSPDEVAMKPPLVARAEQITRPDLSQLAGLLAATRGKPENKRDLPNRGRISPPMSLGDSYLHTRTSFAHSKSEDADRTVVCMKGFPVPK